MFSQKDKNRVSIKCLWDELKMSSSDQDQPLYRIWKNISKQKLYLY